jgi:two-component system, cell cycle sensor histidine kinase and response regulator CckA
MDTHPTGGASEHDQYRQLVELSPDGILVHRRGVIVYSNPVATRLLGASNPEQLEGRSVLEFVHPDSRARVLAQLQRLREGKSVPFGEERFVRVDGNAIDVEVAAAPVAHDGEIAGQVVIRDIARRKSTERSLQDRTRRLQALHETAMAIMDRLHVDETLEAILARAAALVGTEHGYVYLARAAGDALEVRVGMGAFAEWVGFALGRAEGVAGKVWQSGEIINVEDYDTWEGRSPKFPHGVFHAVVAVPLTSGPNVVGVIGLAHLEPGRSFDGEDLDILTQFAGLASIALENARLYTEVERDLAQRREAEEALQFQAQLLSTVQNAVIATDADGRITYWNQVAEELFARRRDDAMSRPILEVVVAAGMSREEFASLGNALGGEPWGMELDLLRGDGSTFTALLSVSPLRDEAGSVVGTIGVAVDLTERKRAEELLRAAFEREKEVTQRLRQVDEMKNTFLHAVSHELRTPLAGVLAFATTLERARGKLSPTDHDRIVDRLAAYARKLDRLLSDLLDIDRLDRGILEPHRRPTEIGALVRATVENAAVGDRPIRVEAEDAVASVDGPKLERIVENLVANAVRHTPPGTSIVVTVGRGTDGVHLVVDDEGPGIPEELREGVFEPFRQAPNRPPHAPGVGIGLSLVSQFAKLHGGRAWVERRDGGGSSFHVLLPES